MTIWDLCNSRGDIKNYPFPGTRLLALNGDPQAKAFMDSDIGNARFLFATDLLIYAEPDGSYLKIAVLIKGTAWRIDSVRHIRQLRQNPDLLYPVTLLREELRALILHAPEPLENGMKLSLQ